jgi:hypothetical protein
MLFKNKTHQDIWIEHHCGRCFFGKADTMCPILHRALRSGRKPVEWQRNPRKNVLMQDSIKCDAQTRTPPTVKQPKTFEDIPMFDVTPVALGNEGDHA